MSSVASATNILAEARKDFPILRQTVRGKPLVYLDNAATFQKPQLVIEAIDTYYREHNANIHRGVHYLSQIATAQYDNSREAIRRLLQAGSTKEIILTKGCTEAINLVATSLTRMGHFKPGDEILVSTMEHHSNIVPWQLAAEQTGATVKPIPITDEGDIDLDAYRAQLQSGKVKLVGVVHVSNSLGTINPVREMVRLAHDAGALVLIDGAQAGPHLRIDVREIDADFYTLSCHKIYAPTGVGVLYGKEALLEKMPPYHGGGDMIRTVSFEGTTYADLPGKFEAGTPNISGVIGLGAAIAYLEELGRDLGSNVDPLATAFQAIQAQEELLRKKATSALEAIGGIRITGTSKHKTGIVSFVMEAAHPHDIGTILDSEGVAIRTGHHCCMPLMQRLGVPATARASFAFYNTEEEVDALCAGVQKVKEMFA